MPRRKPKKKVGPPPPEPPEPKYPGAGLTLDAQCLFADIVACYAHGAMDSESFTSMLLPVREVAMMTLMDELTDDPAWHTKVFDGAAVAAWRADVLSRSEATLHAACFDWYNRCTNEFPLPTRQRLISKRAFEFVRRRAACGGRD